MYVLAYICYISIGQDLYVLLAVEMKLILQRHRKAVDCLQWTGMLKIYNI